MRSLGTVMTPPRLREPLATLVAVCEADPSVLAAWLGGSLARGVADDWSDIDLHILVEDVDEFGQGASGWFARQMPTVLVDRIPGVPNGFIFVTPDWVHVDLVVPEYVISRRTRPRPMCWSTGPG